MIRVQLKFDVRQESHPILGAISFHKLWFVDSATGRKVESDEVIDLFNKLEIVGVKVMARLGAPDVYPTFAEIIDIDDSLVWLSNDGVHTPIMRETFKRWYELD